MHIQRSAPKNAPSTSDLFTDGRVQGHDVRGHAQGQARHRRWPEAWRRRPAVQQHKDKPAARSGQKQGGGGRHSSISCSFCQFRSVLVDFVRYFRNINGFIVILFNF
jgi:hypothetical protein